MNRNPSCPFEVSEGEQNTNVRLVPLVPEMDASRVYELVEEDPDHMRSFDLGSGYYSSLEKTYKYLEEWCKHGTAFSITVSGLMVGNVYINESEAPELATLSYWVAKRYTRQGIGTEAVRQAVDFAFTELGKGGLMASVALDNVPSVALLKKAGFIQIQRHTLDAQSGLVEIGVFGLTNPKLDIEV